MYTKMTMIIQQVKILIKIMIQRSESITHQLLYTKRLIILVNTRSSLKQELLIPRLQLRTKLQMQLAMFIKLEILSQQEHSSTKVQLSLVKWTEASVMQTLNSKKLSHQLLKDTLLMKRRTKTT